MKALAKLLPFLFLSACSTSTQNLPPLEVVAKVDLQRYLGKWYEVARIEHWFQKGCVNSEANYSLRDDGDIKVVNRCIKKGSTNKEDKPKEATARAWVVDETTNAKLKVQFPLREIKLGFLSGNYWIIDLDENYQYVMVGDPTRDYLWILSRSKIMAPETLSALITKAKNVGYDIDRIIYEEGNTPPF